MAQQFVRTDSSTSTTGWVLAFTVVAAVWTAVPAAAQTDSGDIPDPIVAEEYAPPPSEPQPAYAPPPPQAQPVAQPVVTPEPVVEDGPRFRFGVAGGGGFEAVDGLRAWMVGFDFRLGLQLNDLIGIYAQPHLSFGSFGGAGSGLAGTTGTFAVAAMIDFTFIDAFSVGGGFGYGVFNNPSGPMLAIHAAAYPVSGRSEYGPRRRGLSVGVDLRTVFLGSPYGTGVHFLATVGYEAF